MPEEVFWRGSIQAFWVYERAHAARLREQNEFAWLQGIYFTHALNSTMSNLVGKRKVNYPDKPIRMEKRTQEEEKKLQRTTEMIRQHNLLIRAKLSKKQRM